MSLCLSKEEYKSYYERLKKSLIWRFSSEKGAGGSEHCVNRTDVFDQGSAPFLSYILVQFFSFML